MQTKRFTVEVVVEYDDEIRIPDGLIEEALGAEWEMTEETLSCSLSEAVLDSDEVLAPLGYYFDDDAVTLSLGPMKAVRGGKK